MTIQDYLTAFDQWLSNHIHAAVKAGKDFAFRDRGLNCALRLDDDGAAWDYIFLDPGAAPPPGHAWSVYRLHGVVPSDPPAEPPVPRTDSHRRAEVADLAQTVFGGGRAPGKATGAHLRAAF